MLEVVKDLEAQIIIFMICNFLNLLGQLIYFLLNFKFEFTFLSGKFVNATPFCFGIDLIQFF